MTTEQRARQLTSELDRFVRVVVEHMRPERIILFGSFVHGQIDEWSASIWSSSRKPTCRFMSDSSRVEPAG